MPGDAVPPAGQARLREALNRYLLARAAVRRQRGQEGELVAARAALVALMQEAGWEPPAEVRRALDHDRGLSGRRTA